ncbi:metal cation symporter ZIP8 [Callorhinchus milii]|uniref:Zinc transporter ZIP8 n=1 Tax=Callorhinchus milii TaxID=7868 RepID=A0A4W3IXH9_CALMI|nr:metal cation symporter ZIP8 [Callorhinchus milii]|eukprot:gi/632949265/ref/XP_007890061.1/ PREDICTED: zinc transporter ZIP8 [Callorhinchus milii]
MFALAAYSILFINSVLSQNVAPKAFVEDILNQYGNDETLTAKQHHKLLDKLGIVNVQKTDADALEDIIKSRIKCLSSAKTLHLREQNASNQVLPKDWRNIYNTILQKTVVESSRISSETVKKKPSATEVWGFGFLTVTIINLTSLFGVALIPLTKKTYFPKVMICFMGLAIGSVFSNAILQLIPEAFGLMPQDNDYILKSVVVLGGFYLLFFIEKILKILLQPDEQHHSHFRLPDQQASHEKNGGISMVIQTNIISNPGNDTIVLESPVNHSWNENNIATQEAQSQQSSPWFRRTKLSEISALAWMLTLSDGTHNFIDGLAIGVSFTVSIAQGFSTSIAILCEEFLHELGDFMILLNSGMTIPQALTFNFLTACSCYLGLTLGIVVGNNFAPNYIFGLAGGMFLYISLADMFPEMNQLGKELETGRKSEIIIFVIQNVGLFTGFSLILLITWFAGDIKLG